MRLSSVDLPALGGPAIATTSPSRKRSPRSASDKRLRDLVLQLARDRERLRGDVARDIGLVGKIDAGFGQRLRLDQALAPVFGAIAEQTLQLAQRLAALRIGVGVDQIGEAFDRGEVELAVLERAAGELAGLGQPQAVHARERGEQRGDHRASAMQLDLGDVLAGLALRRREKIMRAPRR